MTGVLIPSSSYLWCVVVPWWRSWHSCLWVAFSLFQMMNVVKGTSTHTQLMNVVFLGAAAMAAAYAGACACKRRARMCVCILQRLNVRACTCVRACMCRLCLDGRRLRRVRRHGDAGLMMMMIMMMIMMMMSMLVCNRDPYARHFSFDDEIV